jgi:hypothetical protein
MRDVTPGWKHVAIGFEGGRVSLSGLDPWQLKWHSLEEPPITVAHPSHPQERHSMSVYELHVEGRAVKFGAGEFSNGVWGFYVPA